MKKYLILIFVLVIFSCCKDETPPKIPINVTEINLVDIGMINKDFIFKINKSDINSQEFDTYIRTIDIRKGDYVDTVMCDQIGKELYISVVVAPLSGEWCIDDTCVTMHDVRFKLHNLEKNNYNVNLTVNSILKRFESFIIE